MNAMSAPEIILSATVAALMGSLLVDVFSFVSYTLPNFLRHAKITENPQNPDFAVIAAALKEVQSLGLTLEGPPKDEKPAEAGNPHPEGGDSTITTGLPIPTGHRPDQPVQLVSAYTKITANTQNPNLGGIVAALRDMKSLGLIADEPLENEKPAITRILYPEDRETTTTKRVA